jgi:hypothetical protein
MPGIPRPCSAGVLGLLLLGCGPRWKFVEPSATIEPAQQVQVWHAGRSEVWHGVRVDSGSVTGIPYHRPRSCEQCRLALVRSEIDSLRFGSLHGGLRDTALLTFGIMALVGYLFRGIGGS